METVAELRLILDHRVDVKRLCRNAELFLMSKLKFVGDFTRVFLLLGLRLVFGKCAVER